MGDRFNKSAGRISVIPSYLELLDAQREMTFTALSALSEDQIWQRSVPREWCIGEMLNHNYPVMASALPYVLFAWRYFSWYGKRFHSKPYRNDIPDLYRTGRFPMWVGFLWSPRYHPQKRAPIEKLKADLRELHRDIRTFYEGKEEDILGNISIYDPYFGRLNLIITLRLGIYHDQIHYDDVIKLADSLKGR